MKYKLLLIINLFLFQTFPLYSQSNFQPIKCYDGNIIELNGNPLQPSYSYNGDLHTPKGSLRIVVFFIGYTGDVTNYDLWPAGQIPDWAKEQNEGYDDSKLLNDIEVNIGNTVNLSYFYKQMSIASIEPFKITGVIYPNLIVVDKVYYPFTNDLNYTEIGHEAVTWLNTNEPSYNWGQFDNRTNSPNFQTDNSNSAPDDNIDYAVFVYRDGLAGFSGGASLYSDALDLVTNYSGQPHTYHLTNGHTSLVSGNNPELFNSFFEHEFAHNLYDASHFGNSNAVVGNRFYSEYAWGMMSPGLRAYNCANAWEKWYLGWIDISANGVSGDIDDINDLSATNGIYTLRDFNSTGDAMRIKIPYATDQFLWIENHQGITPFDDRDEWQHYDGLGNEICSVKDYYGNCISYAPKGIMMFEENLASTYTKIGLLGSNDNANTIRPINAVGNYDFTHSVNKQIAWEWYGGNLYNYFKGEANPYGAHSLGVAGRYDFDNLNGIYIDPGYNNPSSNEMSDIILQDGVVEYGPMQIHEAFDVGKKVGLASNPAIHIIQNFSLITHKLDPIYIGGLSVEVLSKDNNTGNITVKIKYDDFDIAQDARWCGEFYLSDNTLVSYPNDFSTNVKSNVTLTIDKSGTTNTDTNNLYSDFIVPTTLTCLTGSYINVESNGHVKIKNGSIVTLQSGSRMELHNNATLDIESGSTLIIEDGALLALYDGATVDIKPGATLIDKNNTANNGIWLDYPNYTNYTSQVKVEGTLSFENGADFIYQGTGFYFFTGTPTLNLSTGSDVVWIGAGLGHTMIELDNAVYLQETGHPITISNGDIFYHDYSSLNIFNTSINAYGANFYGTNPYIGTTAIYGQGIITQCSIKTSTFTNLSTAISLHNFTNPPTALLDQLTFNNCTVAVNAGSVDKIIVSNSLAHNVSATGSTALIFSSCNKAYADNTEVDGYGIAASLGGGTFYMRNASRFYDCNTGISGKDVIIFMRDGSLIEHSHVSAIDVTGAYVNGAFTSLLTMGDQGCAATLNNLAAGIIGKNLLLSIDGQINSQGQSFPPYEHEWFVRDPSNLTGKLFDICYTSPIAAVAARRNIWVQSGYNMIPPAGSWSFLNSPTCTGNNFVPLIAPFATISQCVPNTLTCTPCNHLPKEGDSADTINVASIVSEEFRSDYSPFIENDTTETRDAFLDIAALDLNYDSLAATWSITSLAGVVFPADDSTVLRVMVSKILANDSSSSEKKDLNDIFAPYYDQLLNSSTYKIHYLKVYPNPSSDKVMIEKINNGNIAKISISNLLGAGRYENSIEEKISFNTDNLPAGIYLVKGLSDDGQIQEVQQLVIQKR